jgi:hypothetical protein
VIRAPLVAICALLAAACGAVSHPVYLSPKSSEPHALLKIRVVYRDAPSTSLDEQVTLDGLPLPGLPLDTFRDRRYVRALRVRPGAQPFVVRSRFHHTVTESRVEHYTENEQYQCGTTTMGTPPNTYQQPQYCYRTVQKQRTRYETREVVDAECSREVTFVPVPGQIYLVDYEFHGAECELRCAIQVVAARGQLSLAPCGG